MRYLKYHRQAQLRGEAGYIDPDLGLFVMTEQTLRSRGKCCGNGCRHCPFGRSLAGGNEHESNIEVLPTGVDTIPKGATFLFWSGGKDSYLALLALQESESNIVLCTTFANGMVGHQEIPIATIQKQAAYLQLPLLMIALRADQTYEAQLVQEINKHRPAALAFGDLHLEGIRSWREKYFSHYCLRFPIWNIPYDDLIQRLERATGNVVVSAIGDLMPSECTLAVGDAYTKEVYLSLGAVGVDAFGENGEFHTEVRFW